MFHEKKINIILEHNMYLMVETDTQLEPTVSNPLEILTSLKLPHTEFSAIINK
jgi:hypothetical protein